ncbi:MAG TPA: hypothetical protein VEW48_06390 [Thermoanaerobaculia bacterium]|nr:hypothetical protein [Thermoanaerobaculia bacterium]
MNLTAGLRELIQEDKEKHEDARTFLEAIDQKLGKPPASGLEARATALCLIAEAVIDIGSWEESWIWKMMLLAESEKDPATTPAAVAASGLVPGEIPPVSISSGNGRSAKSSPSCPPPQPSDPPPSALDLGAGETTGNG